MKKFIQINENFFRLSEVGAEEPFSGDKFLQSFDFERATMNLNQAVDFLRQSQKPQDPQYMEALQKVATTSAVLLKYWTKRNAFNAKSSQ